MLQNKEIWSVQAVRSIDTSKVNEGLGMNINVKNEMQVLYISNKFEISFHKEETY